MSPSDNIETAYHMLKTATVADLDALFEAHPFQSDEACVLYLLGCALNEMSREKLAEVCGIGIEAAKWFELQLIVAVATPIVNEEKTL